MRIHIQNTPKGNPAYAVDEAMWQAAVARNRIEDADYEVTIGNSLEDYAREIADAEILLAHNRMFRSLFPAPAPRLKLVMSANAGVDDLAPFDWLPDGVMLVKNSGTHAEKAGEYLLMALLMLANRVPLAVTNHRARRWDRQAGTTLRGKRVTIVGLGAIGGAAADHAKHFGLHVTGVRTSASPHPACDRVIAQADLDSVLPETDYLVLACPLTPATRGLIDRRRLALLPPTAGIANVGRGAVIDEEALCEALEARRLGGAVLDVFATEPLPPDHRMWTTPNVVVTPHMSSDDPQAYMPNTLDVLFRNLAALRQGQRPPNLFDLDRGY
jgi:phosphoglycerate dehydrogenase-like enzyme